MTTNSNFSTPKTITAEYKIITPMFLGNADNKESDTISPQSFKGVMRFWWRATHWEDCRKGANSDAEALTDLHHKEALLFGSSAINSKTNKIYGQGAFSLKVLSTNVTLSKDTRFSSLYIAYGKGEDDKKKKPAEKSKKTAEKNIQAGGEFKIEITFHKNSDAEQQQSIEELLEIMGYVANLGAKSRNGFGSIQLTQLNGQAFTFNKPIPDTFQTLTGSLPPYSALSQETYIEQTILRANSSTQLIREFSNKYANVVKEKIETTKLITGLPKRIKFNTTLSQKMYWENRRTKGIYFHAYKNKNENEKDGKYHMLAITMPSSIYHPEINDASCIPKPEDYNNFIGNLQKASIE
jgi:CRISPR-associated protein Cmr1